MRDVYAIELSYTPHSPLVGTVAGGAGQTVTAVSYDDAYTLATISLNAAITTTGFDVGSSVVLGGQTLVVSEYDSGTPTQFKVAAASLAPSEASVLAKLSADPLAELSAKETLIYEGIVQPLRPIVNDRLEFNGATFNGRAVMPDQATVLDIQDLGDASNPYKFRVFVEVTWQDLQDPILMDGMSLAKAGGSLAAPTDYGETDTNTTRLSFVEYMASRSSGLQSSAPKEFFANQQFTLNLVRPRLLRAASLIGMVSFSKLLLLD